jgi:hypothetical protein
MAGVKKIRKDVSHFVLSRDEKIAMMEAKLERAQAHAQALADLAKRQESARGSKYPPR